MILALLKELDRVVGSRLHSGVDPSQLVKVEQVFDLTLPSDHREALQRSNGAEAYAGYLRLFGVGTTESVDSVVWNQHEFWKFAWGDRCAGYWCFAETAWGDQYAYSLGPLRANGDATVYFLDALSMTPQVVASSFTEFLEKEFIRSAKAPYDAIMKQAREKFGPLEITTHLVYTPSVLLGGMEEIKNVQKMNARSAMICNGDIAVQLDAGPANGTVKAVQAYEDELRRMRLRLVWA
jgi:hypothetical protein